jgi:hypothetical protein
LVDLVAREPREAVAAGCAGAVRLDSRQACDVEADADDDGCVGVHESAEDLKIDDAAHPIVESRVHVHDQKEAGQPDADAEKRAEASAIAHRDVPDGQGVDDE